MPAWVHDRAQHLLAKNPSMDKSQAFAIATQQAHKMGKTPKGYGTPEGKKKAKQKYDKPKKEYKKTPNPGDLETPKLGEVLVDFFSPEVAPPGMKVAFTTSQYSGPLGPGGRVQYAGIVPPFRKPQFKQAGPDEEELARLQKEQNAKDPFTPLAKVAKESTHRTEKNKLSSMRDELAKLNAIQSPEAQITKSQKVGLPKTTNPPGPSIQQVSKPVGFGKPLAGATKPNQV